MQTMQTMPTRITIELEQRDGRRGGWRARTRVDGRRATSPSVHLVSAQAPAHIQVVTGEAAGVAWTPTPYEPGPCTCEDGLCDRDHENE
jgi:hypothetical protein